MKPGFKILLLVLTVFTFLGWGIDGTGTFSQEYHPDVSESENRIIIASYNLGSVDLSDPEVIRMTADIVPRFEITALQCVGDQNVETALHNLVEELNRNGHQYEYLLGLKVGRDPIHYAFVYRTDIVYPVEWHTYHDSAVDDFGYEPFVVRFETNDGMFDLTLVNYYDGAESGPNEADLLPVVIEDVKGRFPDEADIIILCSAKRDNYSLTPFEPFKSLEQNNYVLLLNAETTDESELLETIEPQIIIAASSDEMYWEDAGFVASDVESSTGKDTDTLLSNEQAAFSSIIIVSNEPDDTEDKEESNNSGHKKEGSSSKAFCFFGTASD